MSILFRGATSTHSTKNFLDFCEKQVIETFMTLDTRLFSFHGKDLPKTESDNTTHHWGPIAARIPTALSRLITILLVMLSLHLTNSSGWTTVDANFQNSDSNLSKGRQEFEKGSYAAAIKTLTDSIKANPGMAEAYFFRAKSLDMLGQPMRALKDLAKYIELKPQDPKGHILKGDVNNFNMDHREAIECYSHALRLDSRSVNARLGRGLAYAALERYDLAIKDYEDVLKENSLHHEALTNLGVALALSGKPDDALKKLTEALALERDLEWRSRLNKMIDEIAQSQAKENIKKMNRSPFSQTPKPLLEKPW